MMMAMPVRHSSPSTEMALPMQMSMAVAVAMLVFRINSSLPLFVASHRIWPFGHGSAVRAVYFGMLKQGIG